MLSNGEQRRLMEIESQLRTDDPAFVQRFKDGGQHRLGPSWRGAVALLGFSIAVTVASFGLVLGDLGIVVAASTALGVGTAMWVIQHRRT